MGDGGARVSCTVWELWDKRPEEGQTSYLLPDSSSALRGPSFLALEGVGKDLRASTSALLTWLAVAWHLIPLALTLSYSHAGWRPELSVLYTYSPSPALPASWDAPLPAFQATSTATCWEASSDNSGRSAM